MSAEMEITTGMETTGTEAAETKTAANKFTKRCYGIIVLKSENSNWNADFTKYPRRLPDENATIFATDKALKYSIRRYWVDKGEKVFLWRTFRDDGKPKDLTETDKYWTDILKDSLKYISVEENKKNEAKLDRKAFFNNFIDVKFFGITFTIKGDKEVVSVTGPLQISYGVNRYNVNISYVVDIGSPFRVDTKKTAEDETKENLQTTLGSEIRNLKSYYVYDWVLNPKNLPDGMDITEDDIKLLKEALKKSVTYLNTTTKIGTENALLLFITLNEGSELVLPTMKNLVNIGKDDVIDLSAVMNLLKQYNEEIESIEMYSNDAIAKVTGIEEINVEKKDILL